MKNADGRRKRDAARIDYLENVLDPLLETDPDQYLRSVGDRLLQCTSDIFGKNSQEVELIKDVQRTEKMTFELPVERHRPHTVHFIKGSDAEWILKKIQFFMFASVCKNIDYFNDESLYPFWEVLEMSGMDHDKIGDYFEKFPT